VSEKEEERKKQDSGVLATASKILRVDEKELSQSWQSLRDNKGKLSEKHTWQELLSEMPRRAKASLALIGVLMIAAIWGYVAITSSQKANIAATPEVKVILAAPAPTAEAAPIPVSLKSVNLPTATPTARAKATPLPAVTPVFVFHTVEDNETLIAIAAHYDITTEALLVANNLRDPTEIKTGQHLLIPSKDNSIQQKIVVHEAKKDDTMLKIASIYGSSVKDIQAANPNLSDNILSEGEPVAVPIVFFDSNLAIAQGETEDTIYYTVQPGDTPLGIAAEHNIPVEILLNVNGIDDPRALQVGQEITIPPHDGISLGYPVILYEFHENDTLVGIASRFGSSVKSILDVNPELDPAMLEVGQIIAIPVIFAPARPTPAPFDAPRPTPGPPPPPPPPLTDLMEQLVLAINQQRELHGLPAHRFDMQLTQAALAHAQDMYVRDFFGHVNPDGATLRQRLTDGGVTFLHAGENIQRNTQPRDKTVQTAIDWFMSSAPHRANILHPNHNSIGVAVVEGPPGWYTFVLNFAER
jgi:uncharacterized protein YkwD